MRHNNDIDHITPIIYKLEKENPSILITILIYNPLETFEDDYRIQFLKTLDVNIIHILECLSSSLVPTNLYKKLIHKSKSYGRLNPGRILINKLFVLPIFKAIKKMIINIDLDDFFKNNFIQTPNLIVFDQANDGFYRKLCEYSHSKNIITIAVPHGHNIYANEMVYSSNMEITPSAPRKFVYYFQYAIFENEIIAERYKKMGMVLEDQILIIGSSRFCDEWISQLKKILPSIHLPHPPSKVLKVVILLTKMKFNINRKELIRTILYLGKFPDIQVLIKLHPRSRGLNKKFPTNVEIVNNDYHTPSLIEWADLVLFTGSSAMLDCLKNDVPTLYMKYLHSNKILSENYFHSWEVHCRDDLRDFIWKLKKDKKSRTYTKSERDLYLNKTIEPKGKDVLGNYIATILDFL